MDTGEKEIEILVTNISYNDAKMEELVKKYYQGNGLIKLLVSKFAIKQQFVGISFVLVQLLIKIFNFKAGDIALKEYLKKCEVKRVNLGLELKLELKNLDITKLVNEQVLPKTKGNALVYELLKLLNDDLDNNMKIYLLKLIFDILNEKRIIPRYINKISNQIEDLSGLNLKLEEIKVNVKN